MPGPVLHQWSSSHIKVGKCDKKKISIVSEIAQCTAAWYFWMSNVQSGKDHSFPLQQSVFLHSQIQPIIAQTEVWDKHPSKTVLTSKKKLTFSYLKCVCLIYHFSTKKAIFRVPQNELRLEQRLERASLFHSTKAFRITWSKRQSELTERTWENAVQSGPSGPSCSKAD